MEFQKLISFPHQNDFLLMIHYCCNKKMLHLERALQVGPHYGPHILLYSQHLIDTTYAHC